MTKTLQSILASHFRDNARWRRSCSDWHHADQARNACSADWLDALADYVEALPDDDVGIQTLAGFGWPVEAFRHGAGRESGYIARSTGFRGAKDDPVISRPSQSDLRKSWRYWVTHAVYDREDMDRLLAIIRALPAMTGVTGPRRTDDGDCCGPQGAQVGAVTEDTTRSLLHGVLGRLGRRQEEAMPA